MRWYILYSASGQENKVKELIRLRSENIGISEMIEEILIPTQEKIAIKKGEKVSVTEKIYPGYLFIKMQLNDKTWPLIMDTQGVANFAGTGKRPTPVPESEVQAILKASEEKQSSYKISLHEGDRVIITHGDFKDFEGTIAEIDENKGRLKVQIQFLNRPVIAEVDITNIAKQ